MVTGKQRVDVYKKFNGHCAYCGKEISFDNFHADHIIPKNKGGGNRTDNFYPACHTCNCVKYNMSIDEFREYIFSIPKNIKLKGAFKIMLQIGIIKIENFDRRFYFERVNK